jgi:hypothetical protein
MALRTARLSGGPHDGERIVRPASDPLPDALLAITLEDGVQYAWIADRDEESGETVALLRHDPDGSVLRSAKAARGIDPDAPEVFLG